MLWIFPRGDNYHFPIHSSSSGILKTSAYYVMQISSSKKMLLWLPATLNNSKINQFCKNYLINDYHKMLTNIWNSRTLISYTVLFKIKGRRNMIKNFPLREWTYPFLHRTSRPICYYFYVACNLKKKKKKLRTLEASKHDFFFQFLPYLWDPDLTKIFSNLLSFTRLLPRK